MLGTLSYCIGLPRSGKTTYCKKWVTAVGEKPRVVISGDAFRKAISNREYEIVAEPFVFACMDAATRALLYTGHDVIIDETSTTPETIKRYMRIDLFAQPIFFDVSAEECKKRAVETGKPYLIGPIERMDKQLQFLKENWTEIFTKIHNELIFRQSQDITV